MTGFPVRCWKCGWRKEAASEEEARGDGVWHDFDEHQREHHCDRDTHGTAMLTFPVVGPRAWQVSYVVKAHKQGREPRLFDR